MGVNIPCNVFAPPLCFKGCLVYFSFTLMFSVTKWKKKLLNYKNSNLKDISKKEDWLDDVLPLVLAEFLLI